MRCFRTATRTGVPSKPSPASRRTTGRISILVFTVGLVGTGGCDGEVPVVTDAGAETLIPGATIEALGQAVGLANCEKIFSCCSEAERARIVGVGETRASCEANLVSFYDFQYQNAAGAVTNARAVYDPAIWAQCLDAYRAAGCANPAITVLAVCRQVLTGLVPDESACATGFECTSRTCAQTPQTGDRRCKARKPDGESCERSTECASGICLTTLFTGICVSETDRQERCGGMGFWLVP